MCACTGIVVAGAKVVACVGLVLVSIEVREPTSPPVKRVNPCPGSLPVYDIQQIVNTHPIASKAIVGMITRIAPLFVSGCGASSGIYGRVSEYGLTDKFLFGCGVNIQNSSNIRITVSTARNHFIFSPFPLTG